MRSDFILRLMAGLFVLAGVNATGQVVGPVSLRPGRPAHAFLWSNGVMQDLGTLVAWGARHETSTKRARSWVWLKHWGSVRILWSNGVMRSLETPPV